MAIKIAGVDVINDDRELVLAKLTDINSTISSTAVDVFVYDTSNDSDGGAWRHRTQHTSWYNETLNTSTRGSRKEFPAVAVIVAEASKVTIYDGDDPSLPMWASYPTSGATGVAAVNGEVAVSCDVAVPAYHGLLRLQFLKDAIRNHRHNSGVSVQGTFTGSFATAHNDLDNGASVWSGYTSDVPLIVASEVNDVAMTVLPDAPTDPATGLAVPTTAIATDGGVSVIKDDGTVVDIHDGSSISGWVDFTDDGQIFFNEGGAVNAVNSYIGAIPSADVTSNLASNFQSYKHNTAPYLYPVQSLDGAIAAGDALVYRRNGASVGAMSILAPLPTNPTGGLVAGVTSSYNTGWMNGAIKLAALADTTAGTLSGSELVPSSFSSWLKYEPTDGTVTESAGVITISVNSSSANGYPTASAPLTCEVGKTYVASVSWANNTTGFWARLGTTASTSGLDIEINSAAASGSASLTFVATSTTHYLNIFAEQTNTGAVDVEIASQSVRLADPDRSVNGNGLGVHGSLTKAAVATGADVVGYSNFSSSNYLEQPYNSDLDFGTGDFCVMGWVISTDATFDYLIYRALPDATDVGFSIAIDGANDRISCLVKNTGFQYGSNKVLGRWTHVALIRSGGMAQVYVNGVLDFTFSAPSDIDPTTPASHIMSLGAASNGSGALNNGSLALWRISATAPTADQIAKIYEDEKFLFQENAKATLYYDGTSSSPDAVTALAHDPVTDLLHVGTSSGRSVFQGLRRVDNTTTAVSTAISANDSLIVEQ